MDRYHGFAWSGVKKQTPGLFLKAVAYKIAFDKEGIFAITHKTGGPM